MSFEQQVQQWVHLDNQIKTLNEKLKELRENKHVLTENLTKQAERNNTKHSPLQISDGKLKFVSVNVTNQLTFKYVEKCLGEIIQSKDQVEKIIDYLKKNREVKQVNDIRRFS
jgi:hypothetical protein